MVLAGDLVHAERRGEDTSTDGVVVEVGARHGTPRRVRADLAPCRPHPSVRARRAERRLGSTVTPEPASVVDRDRLDLGEMVLAGRPTSARRSVRARRAERRWGRPRSRRASVTGPSSAVRARPRAPSVRANPPTVAGDPDRLDLVAVGVDGGEDVSGGHAGHVVLGGTTAEENDESDALGRVGIRGGHRVDRSRATLPSCVGPPPRSHRLSAAASSEAMLPSIASPRTPARSTHPPVRGALFLLSPNAMVMTSYRLQSELVRWRPSPLSRSMPATPS